MGFVRNTMQGCAVCVGWFVCCTLENGKLEALYKGSGLGGLGCILEDGMVGSSVQGVRLGGLGLHFGKRMVGLQPAGQAWGAWVAL